MADALQDFVTMTQAASGLIGSLGQLQDTRIKLESDRIASEVGKMNSNFLLRMSAPIGSPQRIDMNNWRDELQRHNEELGQRLSTIQSPTVKTTVESRLGEMTNGFMVNISNKMVGQEIEKAQNDFVIDVDNIRGDLSKSADERLNIITAKMNDAEAKGIMSFDQLRAMRLDIQGTLGAEKIATDAMNGLAKSSDDFVNKYKADYVSKNKETIDAKVAGLMESNSSITQEEAMAQATEEVASIVSEEAKSRTHKTTFEEAALVTMNRTDLNKGQRDAAVQFLFNKQKVEDQRAKDMWDALYTKQEKKENVNVEAAYNMIVSSGASSAQKQEMVGQLQGYAFVMERKNLSSLMGQLWNVNEDVRATSEFQTMARREVGKLSGGYWDTEAGLKYKNEQYAIMDGWKVSAAGADKSKLEAKQNINKYMIQFSNRSNANIRDNIFTGSPDALTQLMSYLIPELTGAAPDEAAKAINDVQNGTYGIDPILVKAYLTPGGRELFSMMKMVVNKSLTMPNRDNALKMFKHAEKSGKEEDLVSQGMLTQFSMHVMGQLKEKLQKSGGVWTKEISKDANDIIIGVLGSAQYSFAPQTTPASGEVGLNKKLATFADTFNNGKGILDNDGEVVPAYADTYEQYQSMAMKVLKESVPSPSGNFIKDVKTTKERKGAISFRDDKDSTVRYDVVTKRGELAIVKMVKNKKGTAFEPSAIMAPNSDKADAKNKEVQNVMSDFYSQYGY